MSNKYSWYNWVYEVYDGTLTSIGAALNELFRMTQPALRLWILQTLTTLYSILILLYRRKECRHIRIFYGKTKPLTPLSML